MNCSDYKVTITLLLTLVVFCGGDTDAVGQVQDTEVVQTESPGAKIAEPAELLGDTPGNRSTLAPLLGSPQAIAIPTSDPATRPAAAADYSPATDSPPAAEATRVPAAAPQQTSGGSPERGQGTPPKADGEDYWKPVPAKTETVEYEKLDAETSRDLFNADSIRNLRKPMSDIRIVAEDDADAPQNLASRFMVK
ncbi:MAG: hypothetical protein ACR2OA_17335, partial [Rubripirellula sp.]